MATSKKPRKSYNKNPSAKKNLKSIQNMQWFAKRLTIVCAQSDPKHILLFKDGRPITTTLTIADMFDNIRFEWTMFFGVLCRDQQENLYIKYIEFNTVNAELLASDLDKYFTESLKDLFKQVNSQHRLTTFYAAAPSVQDINVNSIVRTLHHYKVPDIMMTEHEAKHKDGAPDKRYCDGSWQDLAAQLTWQEFSNYTPKPIKLEVISND